MIKVLISYFLVKTLEEDKEQQLISTRIPAAAAQQVKNPGESEHCSGRAHIVLACGICELIA